MPVYSYPGVYVEEVPSGVRTITGVATSITAFVGYAQRGTAGEPTLVHSFAEFEREFGGLWAPSTLGHVVRQFFMAGGRDALIVRAVSGAASVAKTPAGTAAGTLKLQASSEGKWGKGLRATIDWTTSDPADTSLFNLTIEDTATRAREVHRNVSVLAGSPANVVDVLQQRSRLARATAVGTTRPAEATLEFTSGGADGSAADPAPVIDAAGNLERADIYNLLCLPQVLNDGNLVAFDGNVLETLAESRCKPDRAVLIADPDPAWTVATARAALQGGWLVHRNAAAYFPHVVVADPLKDGGTVTLPPCGLVAGVIARTDAERGIWKAPAGQDATLTGVQQLTVGLTDAENGELNPLGLNCLRTLPVVGDVVWGARTRVGADALADEWKYLPIRRLALYLEETLFRGTRWVVFEPNDEPLWSQIRLSVGSFMQTLFRRGAFQGTTPREAYFVKCDAETTTADDRNRGVVNILVGFAPLKPAEFVVVRIQQIADTETA